MSVKIEERTKKTESAKSVARAIDLIIRTITEARDEGQKMIEEAEATMDDEKFEAKLNEAKARMIGTMDRVALAHTLAGAAAKRGIDLEALL